MGFEVTEIGPPLTDGRIAKLERQLGVVLPTAYRAFLLQYNGGKPMPDFFPIRGLDNNPFDILQHFFGIDRTIQSSNLDWNYKIYKGRMPRNFFPIACTGTGNVICLSLQGQDKDTVYFWDHDSEHRPATYNNVYFIAPSFPEFLESIHFQDISAEVEEIARGAIVIKRPH